MSSAPPSQTAAMPATPSLVTLQTHMLAEARNHGDDSGELSWIFSALSISAKSISAKLRRARLDDVLGEVGNENVQGEQQQKLDVIANNVLIQILGGREGVAVLGSEEDESLIYANAGGKTRYAVLFDPLDGSSNLDICGGVGTIFSIFKVPDVGDYRLQRGRDQVAAGYVLYGSSTVFVVTTGNGVNMFVLDPSIGAFIRVAENLRIPCSGKIYSVNEANVSSFPQAYQDFLDDCRATGFSGRYSGAMVADVHRVLLKGGVFLYPPTEKAPKGKLRLMYECNPMAKIITDAGGLAIAGGEDVLDVEPGELHQRVPVALGSPNTIKNLIDRL